jgi:AraC family transcriptional regulator of adaptative response / DNA-3-methyladenine glycosylase II
MDFVSCYRASESRDPRFDGRFFVGVHTTGIFCRPVCPVPMPRPEHVEFFSCAAAAAAAGFRPGKRCRPEAAPGSALWIGSPAAVAQALRLIEAGYLDHASTSDLAREVYIGERQLRRLFDRHVGVSPARVARSRRLSLARALIDESDIPLGRVALEAGFSSVRRFNDCVRSSFGATPSELRRRRGPGGPAGMMLRLAYRPPFDWEGMLGFLSRRAIPGVEEVREGVYRRTVRLGSGAGVIEARPAAAGNHVLVSVSGAAVEGVGDLVARVRHLFDLDADPWHVEQALGADPWIAPLVRAVPGLRVPGCWDGFELAARAVLGQQVSVAGARTIAGQLTARLGEPFPSPVGTLTHLFPTADRLAEAQIDGVPASRGEVLRALAERAAGGALRLSARADVPGTVRELECLPGIGSWTAQYIALRALGDPDAFPAGDLGLRKAVRGGRPEPATLAEVEARAEAWRPWRAYAAVALWRSLEARGARGAMAA